MKPKGPYRMTSPKLHPDEVDIDVPLVCRLVANQFPRWRDLPISRVRSASTDNAMYRLGDDMVVRLPRLPRAVKPLEKEQRWLPVLGPHLPLAVPEPLGAGVPDQGFPFPWAVYRWIDGESAAEAQEVDLWDVAAKLGRFVAAMQRIDTPGAPLGRRQLITPEFDAEVRMRIRELSARGKLDARLVTEVWEEAAATPPWDGPLVRVHADLWAGNLLVQRARLTAVIDFGGSCVSDPARDMGPAWQLLDARTREVFRAEVDVDDHTWARGRAQALGRSLGAWHVYETTHPAAGSAGKHAVTEIIAEYQHM